MQTHCPSDDSETPATGKRFLIALGLAVVAAITLIASTRDHPMQVEAFTSANIPTAPAQQPLETVEVAFVEYATEVHKRPVANARKPRRALQILPAFDNAARAEMQQNVQKSINASLTRLGNDLARPPAH